jgi:hypothetical protein
MRSKEEIKAYQAAHYAANRARIAARAAAHYVANRDRFAACRAGRREEKAAYNAAYGAANREALNAAASAYRAANRDAIATRAAKRHAANPEKRRASGVAYVAANRSRITTKQTAYRSARRKTDPNFRLRLTISSHLRRIVKAGGVKEATSMAYVGCTVAQLRKHLERQFLSGMTWRNHGEWHIDHIIPLAAFDFAGFPAQIKQAQHYTNLRPMWATDNMRKSDALPNPVQLDLIAP